MFKRDTVPQRQPFSIRKEDLMEDIEALRQCEEQRNKLYLCLDEKPPQDQKFNQLEEFLKGTNNLEDISKTLTNLVEDVTKLKKDITESVKDIELKANTKLVNK